MARIEGSEPILEAAEQWKQRCLLGSGSIFSEERLWTPENFSKLHDLDIDGYKFQDKDSEMESLKFKLESSSKKEKFLFSELIWAYYLIAEKGSIEPKLKLDRIKKIQDWSELYPPYSDGYSETEKALSHGILATDTSFYRNTDKELNFFIFIMKDWFEFPNSRRKNLLEDYLKFAEWIDSKIEARFEKDRCIRHILLFLIFPEEFEPVIYIEQKVKIVESFASIRSERCNIDYESEPVSIDQELKRVRERLPEDYPDNAESSFHHRPLGEVWGWLKSSGPSRLDPPSSDNIKHDLQGTDQMAHSLNTILYGPPGTGKTYATRRRCVGICDGTAPPGEEEVAGRYRTLVAEKRVEFVTFHQSYGYEEFIEGLRPETAGSAGFELKPRDGALKRIADRARQDESSRPHVLVIDEINRANISKVFGEAITLLEEDKREGEENEVAATLPYSGGRFALPPNLYFLGTMNTADRSIALLDTALRRRFNFVELAPNSGKLGIVDGIALPRVLEAMNGRLEWLLGRDHLIGHAWLMGADNKADVDQIMRRKIVPMLAEYFHDDWRKVQAVLGGGREFINKEPLGRPQGIEDDAGEPRYRWTPVEPPYADNAYKSLIQGKPEVAESIAESGGS